MSNLRLADASDIYISHQEIKSVITDLAGYYNQLYQNTAEITALTVMNGAAPFARSIIPLLKPRVIEDSIKLSSMDGLQSTGNLVFERKPQTDLTDKDILVLEDLVDTGLTLSGLAKYLLEVRKARSVQFAALFEKPECRAPGTLIPNLKTGVRLANVFVVGFGLDWNGLYRELSYLTKVKETSPGFYEPAYLEAA